VATVGTSFLYQYDFGDDWNHKVVVEKEFPAQAGVSYPCCVGGRRACPPEDCGGVWGYAEFLAAIASPDHNQHDAMLEWVGGAFDPEAFNPADFAHNLELGRNLTWPT
jgi:hypothetical protein